MYIERRCLQYYHLEDPCFKKHFRMDKATFELLVNAVHRQKVLTGRVLRADRTSDTEIVMIGLWQLFNKDTFRSAGSNLGTAQSSDHYHYKNLIEIICEIGSKYIKWPNARDRQRTARFYNRRFGFPGIAGSMDGTLVPITAPREQKQRYVDKNHNYSINVMLVSDHKRLIRDIYIGQPGSVNDARVFRRSPLAQCLHSRNDMLSEGEHLIGDSGYVCTDKMLTPYRNDGHLTDSHHYYNYLLSQCRATVERCNGLLKMRMQRLERLYCKAINTTCMHLAASAIIHNFILLGGEEMVSFQLTH
ncbi:Protein ANTAGONIST OF LIKE HETEROCHROMATIN PROTEIN 1, partial [Frankliniella fusca]